MSLHCLGLIPWSQQTRELLGHWRRGRSIKDLWMLYFSIVAVLLLLLLLHTVVF